MCFENVFAQNGYQRLNAMPEDPPDLVCHAKQTGGCIAVLKVRPIQPQEMMPVESPEVVIDGIHRSLADDQGLVEVKSGQCCGGGEYIYSIVKTAVTPSGVQYCLVLHLRDASGVVEIVGFFDEAGDTGIRDTEVFAMCLQKGMVTMPGAEGWRRDPYDESRKSGFLMNISERPEYDSGFKWHPLSELRGLVACLIGAGGRG